MAIFEVQGADGKTYEVDAPNAEAAAAALGSFGPMPSGGSSTNSGAVNELAAKLKAMATATADGAAFGFGDNIGAAIGGVDNMMRGGSFSRGYGDTLDIIRSGMGAMKAENPKVYAGGNIVGMSIPAIATSGAATGSSMLGTAARSAGMGAIEGGLQGAGAADGQDVVGEATRGALIGGGAGLASPALVGAAGAVKNAVKDPATGVIDGVFGIANKSKANRAIGAALRQSGKTEADVAAALAQATADGLPDFRLMDALGVGGQRQASGIARAGGDSAAEIARFLEMRQISQPERVGGYVEDAFGLGGTTAAKTTESLKGARGAAADAAYDAARAGAAPVDVRAALGVIDSRIGGMNGSGIVGDGIDGKLAAYRSRLAGDGRGLGADVSAAELSDFDRVLGVKQSLQDDIGAAVRAGRNNEARELGKLQAELDAALEASSDGYRAANDGFREASKVISAVDDGAAMSARGRAADNVSTFSGMNADQQGAARIGYGDDLLNRMERVTSPTANRAKPLQSVKRDAEAAAMATDYPLYSRRLSAEDEMWNTQNRALGGSKTADNIADQEAITGLAGGVVGAAKSAGNLQFGDLAAKLVGALGPLAKGQNEATRKLIAEALMSGDAAAVLGPVMRQQRVSTSTRRMLEALIRQPGREGAESLGQ